MPGSPAPARDAVEGTALLLADARALPPTGLDLPALTSPIPAAIPPLPDEGGGVCHLSKTLTAGILVVSDSRQQPRPDQSK